MGVLHFCRIRHTIQRINKGPSTRNATQATIIISDL